MNRFNFLAIIMAFALMACLIVSCRNNGHQTSASAPSEQKTEPQYVSFSENGKNGFKNAQGEIVVPAEFDKLEIINNIVVATKNGEAFFFHDKKQVFDYGLTSYSVEEKFITAEKNDRTILYFYDTGLKVENIVSGFINDDTFMCLHDDGTYAFYTENGITKASNLKSPICLQKIKNGYVCETRFAFPIDNGNQFLIYSDTGEYQYQIQLTTWQRIAIHYFKRDTDELNDYQYTYNYKIDLDRCIKDHLKGNILNHYPEE